MDFRLRGKDEVERLWFNFYKNNMQQLLILHGALGSETSLQPLKELLQNDFEGGHKLGLYFDNSKETRWECTPSVYFLLTSQENTIWRDSALMVMWSTTILQTTCKNWRNNSHILMTLKRLKNTKILRNKISYLKKKSKYLKIRSVSGKARPTWYSFRKFVQEESCSSASSFRHNYLNF